MSRHPNNDDIHVSRVVPIGPGWWVRIHHGDDSVTFARVGALWERGNPIAMPLVPNEDGDLALVEWGAGSTLFHTDDVPLNLRSEFAAWRARESPFIAATDIREGQWVKLAEPPTTAWKPWTGGDCPVPADQQVLVRYRFDHDTVYAETADALFWEHRDGSGDIIAWCEVPK